MSLYLETADGFTPWNPGESVIDPLLDGDDKRVRLPPNIGGLETAERLATYKLFEPVDPGIPAGKREVSRSVQRINGVVQVVYELADVAVERAEIDAERERRIALPLTVTVPSGLSFQINMDAFAQRNIGGLATLGMYLQTANPSQVTPFMDYTNTLQPLTPADLVAVGLQAQQRIGTVYGYSFALKAMNPIPADYADDSYWGGA